MPRYKEKPNLNRDDFKTSLEYHRHLKSYSQRRLADESGTNVRMIQTYEQGYRDINKCAAITVYQLAKALECSMEDLMDV